jgi:hypothetical protein
MTKLVRRNIITWFSKVKDSFVNALKKTYLTLKCCGLFLLTLAKNDLNIKLVNTSHLNFTSEV